MLFWKRVKYASCVNKQENVHDPKSVVSSRKFSSFLLRVSIHQSLQIQYMNLDTSIYFISLLYIGKDKIVRHRHVISRDGSCTVTLRKIIVVRVPDESSFVFRLHLETRNQNWQTPFCLVVCHRWCQNRWKVKSNLLDLIC